MTNKQPQFFFDTADEQYIRKLWDFLKTQGGFTGDDVVGITTNPNALNKIACNDMPTFNKVIPALCKTITEIREGKSGGVVYVQFPQMTMGEALMGKFINHIISLSDGITKIGLKIAPYEHMLKLVDEFKKQVDCNVTGIADLGTALKCVTYDVRYISIIPGRMEEVGINAKAQVQFVNQANFGQTEIITGSMRTLEGLSWVIEENTVPTIGTRVFDQIVAKGPEGAKEFREMWDKVKTGPRDFVQAQEFAPLVTQSMTDLSLAFFEQMDTLGAPLLKSFKESLK